MRNEIAVIGALLVVAPMGMLVGVDSLLASGEELVVTPEDFAEDKIYSPYVGRAYADQVFFGDTHFHTEVSFDAGLVGTTLDIHDAFRFARGEQITSNTGQPVQLIRPLDFLAITEHAEFNGLATGCCSSTPGENRSTTCSIPEKRVG